MKKFWKSPWTISLVTAIFSISLTAIYDIIKDKPILSTLWGWIKSLWGWFITFINLNLKIWWILIGILVIILLLFVISKLTSKKENNLPDFTSYKEDCFGGWKWSWDWHFNSYERKWHISNLKAHCPQCDTPMFHDSSDSTFQCPRCSFQTDYQSKHKRRFEVEAIIIDNLDRRNKAVN